MFDYLKKLIDGKDTSAQIHNYCGLGSFYVVAGITIMLSIGLLLDKKVGVEFCASLTTLAGYSGYLVKKGNDLEKTEQAKSEQ